mgnify:CR=1 FL=1
MMSLSIIEFTLMKLNKSALRPVLKHELRLAIFDTIIRRQVIGGMQSKN